MIDTLPKKIYKNNNLIEQSKRYRSQIEMNYSEILIYGNKNQEAISMLEDNLMYVTKYSPDYIAEAKYTLAYAYYLNNNYVNAICLLKKLY